MHKETFTIDVGGNAMPVYLARPDDGAPRPAVIVLQEIFGVNTEVKRITDLVASAGYVGLAINYYHRTHPDLNEPYTQEGLQNGFKAAGAVTRASLAADIGAAVAWLDAQPFVKEGHIATWGFCFGGTVAYYSATLDGICAAIPFYGGSISNAPFNGEPPILADTPAIKAPLFLAFGGKDDYIPPEAIDAIRTALTDAHKQFSIQVYPDVGHAFFRDSSQAIAAGDAQGKASADAWERVKAFLAQHLG